ncbi:MAG: hypothetical protein HYW26_00175 [Candidatus Aenigmarchaeota archaeon]|nr:hypothetical protein [Candidatus Aenigmarchaeota archaeon]
MPEEQVRAEIVSGNPRGYLGAVRGYLSSQARTAGTYALDKADTFSKYAGRQSKAVSDYLSGLKLAAQVEGDVLRNRPSQKRRAGALATGLAGLMLYAPNISASQGTDAPPPAPPGAGQDQPPADGQQPVTTQPAPQEEGTIFPCAKSGETWNASNPKFKELFLGPRRQRVLKFSSHAAPYVKAVESGETTATCIGYDISFLRRGQKPFPLRAIGPDGELLMNVIGNKYYPDAPTNLNTDFVITVKGIRGLEQINFPINENRPNLRVYKYDPSVQGRWPITFGGIRYDITEFGIDVWLNPKTSNKFDFGILYFKSGMIPPVQGFKGYTPAGRNFKNIDKSRIFGDIMWEVIDKMNKGNYYGRHSDEFKH